MTECSDCTLDCDMRSDRIGKGEFKIRGQHNGIIDKVTPTDLYYDLNVGRPLSYDLRDLSVADKEKAVVGAKFRMCFGVYDSPSGQRMFVNTFRFLPTDIGSP